MSENNTTPDSSFESRQEDAGLTPKSNIRFGLKQDPLYQEQGMFQSRMTENPQVKGIDVQKYAPYTGYITHLGTRDAMRARGQSVAEKWGNGIYQAVVGEVVGGSLQGLGALGMLVDSEKNFLYELGEAINEGARDATPIYKHSDKAFAFNDAGWWASNLGNILSTVSMLVPGMAVSKGASLAARGLVAAGKAGKAVKAGKTIGKAGKVAGKAAGEAADVTADAMKASVRAQRLEKTMQTVAGGYGMRHAENIREGVDVAVQAEEEFMQDGRALEDFKGTVAYDQYLKDHDQKAPMNKQELASYVGGQAAVRSYQFNMLNLVFDVFQMGTIFKPFKAVTRGQGVGKVGAAAAGKAAAGLDKGTRATRALEKSKGFLTEVGKAATEGIEESINFMGSGEGMARAEYLRGVETGSFGERLDDYFHDSHLYESAFWGFLGGGVFQGLGSIMGKKQDAAMTSLLRQQETLVRESAELAKAEKSGDTEKANQIRARVMADLGIRASQSGRVDQLLDQLNSDDFMKQLQEQGLLGEKSIEEARNELIEGVLKQEKDYKKIAEVAEEYGLSSQEMFVLLKQQNSYDAGLKSIAEKLEAIDDASITEDQKLAAKFQLRDSLVELQKKVKKEKGKDSKTPFGAELKALQEELKDKEKPAEFEKLLTYEAFNQARLLAEQTRLKRKRAELTTEQSLAYTRTTVNAYNKNQEKVIAASFKKRVAEEENLDILNKLLEQAKRNKAKDQEILISERIAELKKTNADKTDADKAQEENEEGGTPVPKDDSTEENEPPTENEPSKENEPPEENDPDVSDVLPEGVVLEDDDEVDYTLAYREPYADGSPFDFGSLTNQERRFLDALDNLDTAETVEKAQALVSFVRNYILKQQEEGKPIKRKFDGKVVDQAIAYLAEAEKTPPAAPQDSAPQDSAPQDPTSDPPTDLPTDDLENSTVKALKAIARQEGLTGYSKLNKAELVAAIRAHREQATLFPENKVTPPTDESPAEKKRRESQQNRVEKHSKELYEALESYAEAVANRDALQDSKNADSKEAVAAELAADKAAMKVLNALNNLTSHSLLSQQNKVESYISSDLREYMELATETLEQDGYTSDHVKPGQVYDETLSVDVEIVNDETLEPGVELIQKINQPEIRKKGKVIQRGQVVVVQGPLLSKPVIEPETVEAPEGQIKMIMNDLMEAFLQQMQIRTSVTMPTTRVREHALIEGTRLTLEGPVAEQYEALMFALTNPSASVTIRISDNQVEVKNPIYKTSVNNKLGVKSLTRKTVGSKTYTYENEEDNSPDYEVVVEYQGKTVVIGNVPRVGTLLKQASRLQNQYRNQPTGDDADANPYWRNAYADANLNALQAIRHADAIALFRKYLDSQDSGSISFTGLSEQIALDGSFKRGSLLRPSDQMDTLNMHPEVTDAIDEHGLCVMMTDPSSGEPYLLNLKTGLKTAVPYQDGVMAMNAQAGTYAFKNQSNKISSTGAVFIPIRDPNSPLKPMWVRMPDMTLKEANRTDFVSNILYGPGTSEQKFELLRSVMSTPPPSVTSESQIMEGFTGAAFISGPSNGQPRLVILKDRKIVMDFNPDGTPRTEIQKAVLEQLKFRLDAKSPELASYEKEGKRDEETRQTLKSLAQSIKQNGRMPIAPVVKKDSAGNDVIIGYHHPVPAARFERDREAQSQNQLFNPEAQSTMLPIAIDMARLQAQNPEAPASPDTKPTDTSDPKKSNEKGGESTDFWNESDDGAMFMTVEKALASDFYAMSTSKDQLEAELWLAKNLPHVPFRRVKGLIERGGVTAYGIWEQGMIRVSDISVVGTEYHEALHAVMDTYLSPKRRAKIMAEARAKYGDLGPIKLEEKIAEAFREYMLTEGKSMTEKSALRRFFSEILALVQAMFQGQYRTRQLMQNINRGRYAYKPSQRSKNFLTKFSKVPAFDAAEMSELEQVMPFLVNYILKDIREAFVGNNPKDVLMRRYGREEDAQVLEGLLQTIAEIKDLSVESDEDGNTIEIQREKKKLIAEGIIRVIFDSRGLFQYMIKSSSRASEERKLEIYDRLGHNEEVLVEHFSTNPRVQRMIMQAIAIDASTGTTDIEQNFSASIAEINPMDKVPASIKNLISRTIYIPGDRSGRLIETILGNQGTEAALEAIAEVSGTDVDKSDAFSRFGLPRFLQFETVYPFLLNQLSSLPSYEAMETRMLELSVYNPSLASIVLALRKDAEPGTLTELQKQFYVGMKRASSEELNVSLETQYDERVERKFQVPVVKDEFIYEPAWHLVQRNKEAVYNAILQFTPAEKEKVLNALSALAKQRNETPEVRVKTIKILVRTFQKLEFSTMDPSALANAMHVMSNNELGGLADMLERLILAGNEAQTSAILREVVRIMKLADADMGAVQSSYMSNLKTKYAHVNPSYLTEELDRLKSAFKEEYLKERFAHNAHLEESMWHIMLDEESLTYRRFGQLGPHAYTDMDVAQRLEYDLLALFRMGKNAQGRQIRVTGYSAIPTPSDATGSFMVSNDFVHYPENVKNRILASIYDAETRKDVTHMSLPIDRSKVDINSIESKAEYMRALLEQEAAALLSIPEFKEVIDKLQVPLGYGPVEGRSRDEGRVTMVNSYVAATYVSNWNVSNWMGGTIDHFGGDVTKYQKRFKQIMSPGQTSADKGTFRNVTIEDPVVFEDWATEVEYSDNGKPVKNADGTYRRIPSAIDRADAQSYVTLDFWERMLSSHGELTDYKKAVIEKARKGEALSVSERSVFAPYKPFYFGWVQGQPHQLKNSVIPLLPPVKGQAPISVELEAMRKWMVHPDNKVDQITLKSAHKVGVTSKATSMFQDGKFKAPEPGYTQYDLPMEFHRNQVSITEHNNHNGTVGLGTQTGPIIMSNLRNYEGLGEVHIQKLLKTEQRMMNMKLKELKGKLFVQGTELGKNGEEDVSKRTVPDVARVRQYVLDNVRDDVHPAVLEILSSPLASAGRISPLVAFAVNQTLAAAVQKDFKKQKVTGGMQVQISDLGHTNPTTDADLKGMRVVGSQQEVEGPYTWDDSMATDLIVGMNNREFVVVKLGESPKTGRELNADDFLNGLKEGFEVIDMHGKKPMTVGLDSAMASLMKRDFEKWLTTKKNLKTRPQSLVTPEYISDYSDPKRELARYVKERQTNRKDFEVDPELELAYEYYRSKEIDSDRNNEAFTSSSSSLPTGPEKVVMAEVKMNRKFLPKQYREMSIEEIRAIDPTLLEVMVYRVPAEGKNSMAMCKVVQFLPSGQDGMVIPAAFVAQMGSDFDIDKLFVNWKKVPREGRELNAYDRAANKFFDLQKDVLMNPEVVKTEVLVPQGFETIKAFRTEMATARRKGGVSDIDVFAQRRPYSALTHLQLWSDNVAGIGLKGIAANNNTFWMKVQRHNMQVEGIPMKDMPLELMQWNAEAVAASMDGAKDPVWGTMGIDRKNFSFFMYECTMGYMRAMKENPSADKVKTLNKARNEALAAATDSDVMQAMTTRVNDFNAETEKTDNVKRYQAYLKQEAYRALKDLTRVSEMKINKELIDLLAAKEPVLDNYNLTLDAEGNIILDSDGNPELQAVKDAKGNTLPTMGKAYVNAPVIKGALDIATASELLMSGGMGIHYYRTVGRYNGISFPQYCAVQTFKAADEFVEGKRAEVMGERSVSERFREVDLEDVQSWNMRHWIVWLNTSDEGRAIRDDKDNAFLRKMLLHITVGRAYEVNYNRYDRITPIQLNDPIKAEEFQKAWENTLTPPLSYEGSVHYPSEFAKALVRYEAARSGWRRGSSTFTQFLPTEIVKNVSGEDATSLQIAAHAVLDSRVESGTEKMALLSNRPMRYGKHTYVTLPGENRRTKVTTPVLMLGFRGMSSIDAIAGELQVNQSTVEEEIAEYKAKQKKSQSLEAFGDIASSTTTSERIAMLQSRFASYGIKVRVEFDSTLEGAGDVQYDKESGVIRLHPDRMKSDTVLHEFGHIYIEMLGFENPAVQQAIEELRNTELYREVAEMYPHLSQRDLDMEVLATAIGLEGDAIYDKAKNPNKLRTLINKLFRALGKLFGIQPNTARELARKMIEGSDVRTNNLKSFRAEQRLKKGLDAQTLMIEVADEIMNRIDHMRRLGATTEEQQVLLDSLQEDSSMFREVAESGATAVLDSLVVAMSDYLQKTTEFISHAETYVDTSSAAGLKKQDTELLNQAYQLSQVLNTFSQTFASFDKDTVDVDFDQQERFATTNKAFVEMAGPVQVMQTRLTSLVRKMLNKKLVANSSNPRIKEAMEAGLDIFSLAQTEFGDITTDTSKGEVQFMGLLDQDSNAVLTLFGKTLRDVVNTEELQSKQDIQKLYSILDDFESQGGSIESLLDEDGQSFVSPYRDAFYSAQSKATNRRKWRAMNMEQKYVESYYLEHVYSKDHKDIKVLKEEIARYEEGARAGTLTEADKLHLDQLQEDLATREQSLESFKKYHEPVWDLEKFEKDKADAESQGPDVAAAWKAAYVHSSGKPKFNSPYYKTSKVKDKFLNPKWTGTDMPKAKWLNPKAKELSPLQQETIEALKNLMKNAVGFEDHRMFNESLIPQIENPESKSLTEVLRDMPREALETNKDTARMGTDSEGRKIFLRGGLKHSRRSDGLVSTDLRKTIAQFVVEARAAKAANNIETFSLMTRDELGRMELTARKGWSMGRVDGKRLNLNDNKRAGTIKGDRSNSMDVIEHVLEGYLGQGWQTTGKYDSQAALLQSYISFQGIGFNPSAWVNNIMYGELMQILDAVGGDMYTSESLNLAKKQVYAGIRDLALARDKGTKPKTRLAAVMHFFDATMDQRELPETSELLDKFYNLAYIGQSFGELLMQSQVVLAMMYDTKVKLDTGETVNLYEALTWDGEARGIGFKAGKVIRKDGTLVDLDINYLGSFKTKAVNVLQRIHGSYNAEDMGRFHRIAVGRLVLQFRKWMPQALKKRFGADRFSEVRETEEIGYYRALWDKIIVPGVMGNVDDAKRFRFYATYQSQPPHVQKAIKRAAIEMGLGVSSAILSYVLASLIEVDSDEEDEFFLLNDAYYKAKLLYHTERLNQELVAYTPWGMYDTALRIGQDPAAASRQLKTMFKFMQQAVYGLAPGVELERFKGGRNYGDLKISTYALQLLPLLKQALREMNTISSHTIYKLS